VGQDLHWLEGINLLEHFGFNLVVIPHWNNAEGGTHDTRFCYMGLARLRHLESLLPEEVIILGLDEHTACLLDLEKEEASIRGLWNVTLRQGGLEKIFQKGEGFPLEMLRRGGVATERSLKEGRRSVPAQAKDTTQETFGKKIHALVEAFNGGLEKHEAKEIIGALLELERIMWKGRQDMETRDFIAQARETLRELIVTLGVRLESSPTSRIECLTPLVGELLALREKFREEKKYEAADAIRQMLERAEVIVEDTREGSQWRLK
jgi:hypothetical protein